MACRQHVRSSSSISNVNQQTDNLGSYRVGGFVYFSFLHTRLSVLSVLSVVGRRRVEVEDCRQSPRPLTEPTRQVSSHYQTRTTSYLLEAVLDRSPSFYFHVPPGSAKIGIDR